MKNSTTLIEKAATLTKKVESSAEKRAKEQLELLQLKNEMMDKIKEINNLLGVRDIARPRNGRPSIRKIIASVLEDGPKTVEDLRGKVEKVLGDAFRENSFKSTLFSKRYNWISNNGKFALRKD